MKRNHIIFISCFIFYGCILNASDQIPAPPQSQPIALLNGTIHPLTAPVLENGMILFDEGKIVEIGALVDIPPDAIRVDVSGKHVYPALIETYSQLGLTEIGAVRPTRDYSEIGDINPNVCAEVAINPESELIPVARANGVALAVTLPSGGMISGKSALLMLDGWTWEDMTLKAPVSLLLNWPRMRVISAWWMRETSEQQRVQIKKQIDILEKAFREAEAYKVAREAAERKGIPFHKFDVRWEAMIPVLRGELPVWVRANSLQQIEAAVNWADQQRVKMVLVGGADAWRVADLLKRKQIAVIIPSIFQLPFRRDADYDEPFTLPLKLHEAGIKFCIASSSTSNMRNLPYHAAKAAAHGLPKEEALKAITLYPAEIIGVAERVGSLEKGKDATLMVTDGDPLELTTQVERLYIQGKDVDLNNKHRMLYRKYKERYSQLKQNIHR